jgi:hypothetical protein
VLRSPNHVLNGARGYGHVVAPKVQHPRCPAPAPKLRYGKQAARTRAGQSERPSIGHSYVHCLPVRSSRCVSPRDHSDPDTATVLAIAVGNRNELSILAQRLISLCAAFGVPMSARPPQFGRRGTLARCRHRHMPKPKLSPSQPGEAPEKARAPRPYEASCIPHSLIGAHMFFRLPATSPRTLLRLHASDQSGRYSGVPEGDVKSGTSEA